MQGSNGAVERVLRYLEAVKNDNPNINAIVDIDEAGVLDAAASVDKQTSSDRAGSLAGTVFTIKSNINVKGLRASCASETLKNYVAGYDATVISRLRDAGALIIGTANMDEFACGSSGETSCFGPTKNPAAPDRVPGGSSSGSVASVAAGFCDASLGSDTGGSIRNPASHCGVAAIKPTYGCVSRYGLIDLAMSLDQIGPIAKDTVTLAEVLGVIAGHDPRDATSIKNGGASSYSKNLNDDLSGLKVGVAQEFEPLTDPKIMDVINKKIELLEELGAEIKGVTLPHLGNALPTYYLTMFVEFFSATRKFDGRRYGKRIEAVCGREVLRRIEIGRYISQKEFSGRYYKKALQFRSLIKKELLNALKDVDVIVGPTVPKLPHRTGETIDDPLTMYAYDVLTVPANLAGIPAGVTPAGKVDGVPVGLQIQGKPLGEQTILNAMHALESANGGRR
ncbi:glutamyl-tRNA(Gln) amidotransferase subunit A [archaeon BMS3Abin16]|nr:glutamyl-tRNA(Gln) amidotransferase subunit A [archaeon BMS3Abin16]